MLFHVNKNGFSVIKYITIMFIFAVLTGCSSPTEKATKFYQNGMKHLDKGDLVKAKIEFQNALQIKGTMVSAWYGLAQIAENEGDVSKLYGLLNKVVELDANNVEAKIKLGRLLLVAGQVDKALEMSDAALALAPENVDAQSLKAGVFLKLNDNKAAVDLANALLLAHPNNLESLVVLATERMSAGDFENAIIYLDQGLKQNEKNIALQLIKINALKSLKQNEDAIEVHKKIITFYPDSNELKEGLVGFYYQLGKMDDADALMRLIIKQNPKELKYKTNYIKFLHAVKGVETAQNELAKFVESEPENFDLKLLLVNFYQSTNQKPLAINILNNIIKTEGDSENAIKAKGLLATMLLENGDKEKSSALVESILEKDKGNEQALLLKASMQLDKNLLEDAIVTLRVVLRDSPNSSRALLMLAKAYESLGSYALADENYQRAFQTSKLSSQYGTPYAQYLIKRAQYPRAEKVLEDQLLATPNDLKSLELLAQAKLSRGDWAGAQKVADDLRKFSNSNVADEIMGVVFAAKKNYSDSISSFQRVYEASPNDMQPITALVKAYLVAGKTKDALVFLDKILKTNPNNTNVRMLKSQLLIINGNKEQAIDSYHQLLAEEPNNVEIYQQLATIQLRDNKLVDAESTIKTGLSKAPDNFALLLSQAGIYELTQRYTEAIQVYEKVLKSQPQAEIAANNYASLLTDRKEDKASFEKAYQISQRFKNSDIPQFKDTLGWAAYRMEKYDEALSLIKSASEQLPQSAIIYYHLGKVYESKLDKLNAKRAFENVLKYSQGANFEYDQEVKRSLKNL